jgi:hypothetical protein
MVIVVLPFIVGILYATHIHYRDVHDALVLEDLSVPMPEMRPPVVIVPVARIDRAALQAVAFARSISKSVKAVPAGVTVTIDGHPVKDPGAELYLEAGSHQVVATGAGFAGSATVELIAGEKRTLQMAMERQPAPNGHVEVLCQPWCEIEVDGRKTGRTSPARLGLSPGIHRIRCINPALGVAKDRDVVVEVDTSQRVVVNLRE